MPKKKSSRKAPSIENPKPATTVEEVRKLLASFFDSNPGSEIGEIEPHGRKMVAIKKPWGDDSLAISIPTDGRSLITALNNIYLPERFSAIWHKDTKDLEFIWTAFPLNPLWSEIPGRAFVFRHVNKEYRCEYAGASERLLTIAEHYVTLISGRTADRNLQTFQLHASRANAKLKVDKNKVDDGDKFLEILFPKTEPRCFWIRNVEWNEDAVLDLAHHLNFYMTCYDSVSPTIEIHASTAATSFKPQTRYMIDSFPARIDGHALDDNLLQLWDACRKGDEGRRFLYCYRIIEYASFSYLDAKARSEIRQILSLPHAALDISGTTELVVSALQKSQLDEYQRFEALLRETVKPQLLWREIVQNLPSFTSRIQFDGGYELEPLVAVGTTEAQYPVNGIQNFARSIRGLRNSLSHGKDNRTTGVITPTIRNFELLRPWISLISVAASWVILNESTI